MTNGTVECLHCHTPVPSSSRYCSACGADQSGGDGPPSTAAAAALLIRLQRLVEGKYRIERMLGRGGMGTVYLAHDLTLEREVAIKVLPPDVAQDEQVVRRFQQEAKTAAKLDHPNIIPIYRVESEGGLNYIVMKYVAGSSLEDVLEHQQRLATDYIQRVLWEAACALGHAHQRGVVHRDVKPANIMFDHDGRVMLADFGISKALQGASGFTATGTIIGTPHYMAPEQIKGGVVDGRADEYSLGVVGYRMLSGRLPYVGDSVHTILYKHVFEPVPSPTPRPDVPGMLSAAITRAMAKDSELRFPTMEAFATAVWPEHPVTAAPPVRRSSSTSNRAIADQPTEVGAALTTPLPSATGIPWSVRPPRSRATLVVVGVGVAAVAATAAYLALGHGKATPSVTGARVDTVHVADTVRVAAPAGLPSARRADATHPRSASPAAQARGYLTVSAEPYGELYIDDVDVGPTPIVRYAVPRGIHTIKIVREGYRTVTDRVQVDAGNTVPKRYTLLPGG